MRGQLLRIVLLTAPLPRLRALCCHLHPQLGNAIGFLPGSLLFSAFGQSGTSIIRAVLDGETGSTAFAVSVSIIVIGVAVLVFTLLSVRRAVRKRNRAAGEVAAKPPGLADTDPGVSIDLSPSSPSPSPPARPAESLSRPHGVGALPSPRGVGAAAPVAV